MNELLIVIVCLVLNAFLAAFEMAFVTLTRSRLKELATKTGNATAYRLLQLRQNPERTLSAIQVGITLVGALAAAVGGAEASETFAPYIMSQLEVTERTSEVIAVTLVVIPFTVMSVVFGELVPKTLAMRSPLKVGLFATRWLLLLDRIFLPLVNLLEWTTKRLLSLFFPRSRMDEIQPGAETVELDLLSVQARQYVLNLVAVEKKRVRDVTLPWSEVDFVSLTDSISAVETMILRSGHTRLPVMNEGQINGIINTKELIALVKAGNANWHSIVRPISKVSGGDTLLRALRQMQEKRSHLSAVFEMGSLNGIVTMEDIIEEIIGEVYDEDDDGALKRILSARMRR